MLTHPKPEEPETTPTPAQRDGTQDGTGKLFACWLSECTSNVSRQCWIVPTIELIKYPFVSVTNMVEVKNNKWCMLNTYSVRQLVECFEHFFVRFIVVENEFVSRSYIHTVYTWIFLESSYTVVNRRDD